MRRAEAFPSRFLSQANVPEPIIATIASVWQEELQNNDGRKMKNVMGFIEKNLKPMVVNTMNWDILEATYGDSDDWRGKPVEIYVNPDVMMGTRRVGGLRVRIPAPRNGAAAKPAPKPQTPAQPPRPSLAERFAQASKGLKGCTDPEHADRWLAWAQKIPFTEEQHEALQELHSEVIRDLTSQPAMDDIPF